VEKILPDISSGIQINDYSTTKNSNSINNSKSKKNENNEEKSKTKKSKKLKTKKRKDSSSNKEAIEKEKREKIELDRQLEIVKRQIQNIWDDDRSGEKTVEEEDVEKKSAHLVDSQIKLKNDYKLDNKNVPFVDPSIVQVICSKKEKVGDSVELVKKKAKPPPGFVCVGEEKVENFRGQRGLLQNPESDGENYLGLGFGFF